MKTVAELEKETEARFEQGKIYALEGALLKGVSLPQRRDEDLKMDFRFRFVQKTGNLFQFKNVAGGYYMTLSAAQLIPRKVSIFKE